jgi:hypothetical protein
MVYIVLIETLRVDGLIALDKPRPQRKWQTKKAQESATMEQREI